jgi:hypothetical protein
LSGQSHATTHVSLAGFVAKHFLINSPPGRQRPQEGIRQAVDAWIVRQKNNPARPSGSREFFAWSDWTAMRC